MDFSQSIDREQLREVFRSPFDPEVWDMLLRDVFGANKMYVEPRLREIDNGGNEKVTGYDLGEIVTPDNHTIGLFRFEIKAGYNIPMNKAGLRGFVEKDIKYFYDAALVVFYNETQWRLSYICDMQEGKTAPKRFTYVFGDPAQTYRTPLSRFEFIKAEGPSRGVIHEAFSVESLGKDFFDGYKRQYRIFCDHIGGGEKWERDYVKKLLGRLVFLQFLQKKGWMGVPAAASGWEGGDPNFMSKLIDRYEGREDILSHVLEPLFFDTLNTRRERDIADPRLGEDIKIPYLNGGLFDRSELDREHRVDFPYALFKGLMDFFISYNFTIDENDPDDIEVGIDPEMLGHIFENLLEDNKDKGAYYTPKEIVQYMSCESIRQYLHNNTSPECHAWVDKLVLKNESDGLPRSVGLKIQSRLKEVKVCDPAIGSGAFPMGILSVIYRCRLKLYGANISSETFSPAAIKRQIIRNNIYGVDIEQGAVDIARLRFWLSLVVDEEQPEPLPNLDFKIMQGNSLLESFEGVDLSKFTDAPHTGADMLGSLFDAQTREAIEPLIQHHFSVTDHAEKESIRERIDAIIRHHIEDSLDRRERELTRERDFHAKAVASNREFIANPATPAANRRKYEKSLRTELLQLRRAERDLEKIAASREHIKHVDRNNMPFFLWHVYFKDVFDRGGFDIVIGNPPYIQIKWLDNKLVISQQNYSTFIKSGDTYCLFYELATRMLKRCGIGAFITSNKWLRASYGSLLRNYLVNNTNPLIIIDFGSGVFDSATVDTNILIWRKGEYSLPTLTSVLSGCSKRDINIEAAVQKSNQRIYFTSDQNWVLLANEVFSIKTKIERFSTTLGDAGVELYYGILTGANKVFLIDKSKAQELISLDSKNKNIIKPLLRGQDIVRYGCVFKDKYLLNVHNGIKSQKIRPINIEKDYPTLLPYFNSMGAEFRARGEQGDNWYNLRNCAYINLFESPKIIYADIVQDKGKFYYDELGYYTNDTAFIIVGDNLKSLTAILNSTAFTFFYKTFYSGGGLGDNGLRYKKEFLLKVPIPELPESTTMCLENLVDQIIAAKRQDPVADTAELEARIDSMVYELYGLTQDEIEIVEGRKTDMENRVTSTGKEYDFFISHASEDKEAVVRKLAEDLRSAGFKVWYDEFELHIGDSLRKKIDYGLSNSSYGLVILSKNFFNKNWTEYELNGMIAREENGQRVVLPVWHGITKKDVLKFSPSLADKMALNTATHSNEEIIDKLKAMVERDKRCGINSVVEP